MDDVDISSENQSILLASGITAVRRRAASMTDGFAAPPTARACKECGEDIEPERLKGLPKTELCCSCAAEMEAAARYRRTHGPR